MKTLDEVVEYAQMIVDIIPQDGAERYEAWVGILYYLKSYKELVDNVAKIIIEHKELFKTIIDEAENENTR